MLSAMIDDRVYPTVIGRRAVFQCSWFTLVSREVQTGGAGAAHEYFALSSPDFACTCARTRNGLFLLVRQYRPAIEQYTWEFPAGTNDPGEDPELTAERELFEETGHRAMRMHALGSYGIDFGRLSNRVHCFFADVDDREPDWAQEAGIKCEMFSATAVDAMVRSGDLACIQHVALWQLSRSLRLASPNPATWGTKHAAARTT